VHLVVVEVILVGGASGAADLALNGRAGGVAAELARSWRISRAAAELTAERARDAKACGGMGPRWRSSRRSRPAAARAGAQRLASPPARRLPEQLVSTLLKVASGAPPRVAVEQAGGSGQAWRNRLAMAKRARYDGLRASRVRPWADEGRWAAEGATAAERKERWRERARRER
jgi:hypothetical protein